MQAARGAVCSPDTSSLRAARRRLGPLPLLWNENRASKGAAAVPAPCRAALVCSRLRRNGRTRRGRRRRRLCRAVQGGDGGGCAESASSILFTPCRHPPRRPYDDEKYSRNASKGGRRHGEGGAFVTGQQGSAQRARCTTRASTATPRDSHPLLPGVFNRREAADQHHGVCVRTGSIDSGRRGQSPIITVCAQHPASSPQRSGAALLCFAIFTHDRSAKQSIRTAPIACTPPHSPPLIVSLSKS